MSDALGLRLFNDQTQYGSWGMANVSLDGSGDGAAWVFQPFSTDPITHLGYRYGARTGTPPTYSIRLEGLDSTGLPDNTDVGGGSATAVTFTPPADATINGLWQWKALTNAYTPSLGQTLCATIRHSSGSVDASNCSSFTLRTTTIGSSVTALPYSLDNLSGSWTKRAQYSIFGWRTASGRFGRCFQSSYTTATANTAGHKSGMYFTLPSGLGSTYRIRGLNFVGDSGASSGSCKFGIWSTDGTVRRSVTWDCDHQGAAPNVVGDFNPIIFTDAHYDFAYGTKYYAGVEVVSGAVGVHGHVVAEADDRSAYPNGTNRGLVTYNGSTWAETDTVLPLIDLILEDVTIPAGGGGGPAFAMCGQGASFKGLP